MSPFAKSQYLSPLDVVDNRRPYFKQTVLVVLERYLREFFSTPLRYDRNLANAIYRY